MDIKNLARGVAQKNGGKEVDGKIFASIIGKDGKPGKAFFDSQVGKFRPVVNDGEVPVGIKGQGLNKWAAGKLNDFLMLAAEADTLKENPETRS